MGAHIDARLIQRRVPQVMGLKANGGKSTSYCFEEDIDWMVAKDIADPKWVVSVVFTGLFSHPDFLPSV